MAERASLCSASGFSMHCKIHPWLIMSPDSSEMAPQNLLKKMKLLVVEFRLGVTSLEDKTSETNWPSILEVVQRRKRSTTGHRKGQGGKVRHKRLINEISPSMSFYHSSAAGAMNCFP